MTHTTPLIVFSQDDFALTTRTQGKRVDTPQGATPQWTRAHGQVSVQTRAVLDHGGGAAAMRAHADARLEHEEGLFAEARGPLKRYNDLAALNARTKYGFW